MDKGISEQSVLIRAGTVGLEGVLALPPGLWKVVIFAQAAGARQSMAATLLAEVLNCSGIGTLVFDLLTPGEDTPEKRICIGLLEARLLAATNWLLRERASERFSFGYLGVEAGAAASIRAASKLGDRIHAVVSVDGWPDLAEEALGLSRSPTLLLAGEADPATTEANRKAFERITAEKSMRLFPGVGRLLEEPMSLKEAAHLAALWFEKHLL